MSNIASIVYVAPDNLIPFMNSSKEEIGRFLDEHGFEDLSYLGSGGSSLALRGDNPQYIFRFEADADKKRLMAPHTLQPIVRVKFDDILCMEILPFLPDTEITDENTSEIKRYLDELHAAGYRTEISLLTEPENKDLGRFQREGYNVLMNRDAGAVCMDNSRLFPTEEELLTPPKCTKNYPPLDAQWRWHCEITAGDDKLRRIVREVQGVDLPLPLPETQIIEPPSWIQTTSERKDGGPVR